MATSLAAQKYEAFVQAWRPTPEKVELAVRTVIEIARPSRVILFGSWARGEAQSTSDLDLAVLISDEHTSDLAALRKQMTAALAKISMTIDLVVVPEGYFARFDSSVNSIYYKIAHEGKLVYERRTEIAAD